MRGFFTIFAVTLLIMSLGCQNNSISTDSTLPEQGIDLDSPTGGLSTSDEAPAFGEPDMFAFLSDEDSVGAPLENTDREDSLTERGARFYEFRAVWGRLAEIGDTNAVDPCPIDWSGTLHLNGGIIILEETIAFEEDDSVSLVDSSTISWVSHTGPGMDGIQVRLIVPPADSSSSDGSTQTLELSAGPYSRTFTMDELLALNLVYPVDMCGNAISITSVLAPPGCPHGQLMGVWKTTDPDSLERGVVQGVFRGVWIGRGARIEGHMKGIFGLNAAGERVFFGKYIDLTGRFKGILRGKSGLRGAPALDGAAENGDITDAEIERPRGWFAGEWIDVNLDVQGKLKGRWIASEKGKGFFHGIWGMLCSEAFLPDDSDGGCAENE